MSNQVINIPNFPTLEEIQRRAKAARIRVMYDQLSDQMQNSFANEIAFMPIDHIDIDALEIKYGFKPAAQQGLPGLNNIVNNSGNSGWGIAQISQPQHVSYDQLSVQAKLAQEMHDFMKQHRSVSIVTKKCECGAKHTSSPNWHSMWCPLFEK
jgi:hypothetical protein